MGSSYGLMGRCLRESGEEERRMGRASSIGLMVKCMLENLKITNVMEQE